MTSEVWTLHQAVDRFQRLHRRQGWKLGAVRFLWVAVACALTLVYADVLLQLNPHARLALVIVSAVTLLIAGSVPVYRYIRAASQRRMVARLVEESHPELHNDLINAIDFDERLQAALPHRFSPDLMQQEIAVATEKVGRLHRGLTLPAPAIKSEAVILLALVVVTGVFASLFPRMFSTVLVRFADPFGDHVPYSPTVLSMTPGAVTVQYGEDVVVSASVAGKKPDAVVLKLEDLDGKAVGELPMIDKGDGTWFQTVENVQHELVYHASIHRGRSNRFTLALDKAPRIGAAMITYEYPAYTKLPAKTRQIASPAEIKAYEGTNVQLELVSNRPLSGGTWDVAGNHFNFQPKPDDVHTALANLTIENTGTFTAELKDVEGLVSHDKLTGTVAIQPDEKPVIEITSPGRQSFASVEAEVPIVIEVSDDLGVNSVSLVRNLNASLDLRKDLFGHEESQVYVNTVEMLNMKDLGVRPGDVIEFYATATDTFPKAAQSATTAVHRLQIISEEEFRSFMQEEMTADDLAQKYDSVFEKIDALASSQQELEEQISQMLKQLKEQGTLSPADQKALAQAQQEQAALAEEAKALAEEIASEAEKDGVFDVEKSYQEAMKEMAKQVAAAQQSMEQSAGEMEKAQQSPSSSPGQSSMSAANTKQREALEQLGRTEAARQQIQEANKDMADVYHLMENVEQFKYLYEMQDNLERQARFYQQQKTPTADQAARLQELADQQAGIRQELSTLKEAFRENAKAVEKNYPKVAQDARNIADEIDSRAIEPTMDGATGGLGEGNAKSGHEQAAHARDEMKAMIKVCESAGQGQSQCELRLNIMTNNGMGKTFSQFGKSLGKKFGKGNGNGMGMGAGGQGGTMGGSTPFDVYGNQAFGNPKPREQSAGGRRMNRDAPLDSGSDPLSGNLEEAAYEKDDDFVVDMPEGERYVEEYRGLISAYFRRIAEEDK
ncbi:MAG: hypothetical protein AMXMBFR84_29830 [Candidatus Hydrogenedentota bacterium]